MPDKELDDLLAEYTKLRVDEEADRQGVPKDFARRLFGTESSFKPEVIKGERKSRVGATGPGQLMPGTAKDLGVDPYHIEQNIEGSTRYAKQQLTDFGGDQRKAAAAYNWGPRRVKKYGTERAPAETQNYMNKVAGEQQPQSDIDNLYQDFQKQQSSASGGASSSRTDNVLRKQQPDKPAPTTPRTTQRTSPPSQPTTQPDGIYKTPSIFGRSVGSDQLLSATDQPRDVEREARIAAAQRDAQGGPFTRIARRGLETIASIPEGFAELGAKSGAMSRFPKTVQEAQDRKRRGLPATYTDAEMEVKKNEQRQFGRSQSETARQGIARALPIDEKDQGFLSAKVPDTLGSIAGFAALGGAGRALRVPAAATSAAVGSAVNISEIAREADAAGVDPAKRERAIALAGVTGLTEAFGVGRALDKFGLKRQFIKRAIDIAEEGGQEALQQYLNNVNAAMVGGYDPNRPGSQGVLEGAVLGALGGGAVQAGSKLAQVAVDRIRQPQILNAPGTTTGRVPVAGPPPGQTVTPRDVTPGQFPQMARPSAPIDTRVTPIAPRPPASPQARPITPGEMAARPRPTRGPVGAADQVGQIIQAYGDRVEQIRQTVTDPAERTAALDQARAEYLTARQGARRRPITASTDPQDVVTSSGGRAVRPQPVAIDQPGAPPAEIATAEPFPAMDEPGFMAAFERLAASGGQGRARALRELQQQPGFQEMRAELAGLDPADRDAFLAPLPKDLRAALTEQAPTSAPQKVTNRPAPQVVEQAAKPATEPGQVAPKPAPKPLDLPEMQRASSAPEPVTAKPVERPAAAPENPAPVAESAPPITKQTPEIAQNEPPVRNEPPQTSGQKVTPPTLEQSTQLSPELEARKQREIERLRRMDPARLDRTIRQMEGAITEADQDVAEMRLQVLEEANTMRAAFVKQGQLPTKYGEQKPADRLGKGNLTEFEQISPEQVQEQLAEKRQEAAGRSEARAEKTARIEERLATEAEAAAPKPQPREPYAVHQDYGPVYKAADQKGVRRGKIRVVEEDGQTTHEINKRDKNQRAIIQRAEEAPAAPVESPERAQTEASGERVAQMQRIEEEAPAPGGDQQTFTVGEKVKIKYGADRYDGKILARLDDGRFEVKDSDGFRIKLDPIRLEKIPGQPAPDAQATRKGSTATLPAKQPKAITSTEAPVRPALAAAQPSAPGGPRTRQDVENSPEFRRWFKGSDAADKDGRALRLYHGTGANFETFGKTKERRRFYFTESPSAASMYAERGGNEEGGSAMVMPVNLQVKAFDLTKPIDAVESTRLLQMVADEVGIPLKQAQSYLKDVIRYGNEKRTNGSVVQAMEELIAKTKPPKAGELTRGAADDILMKAGYTGLKTKPIETSAQKEKANTWIVFSPEQIKSATGNRGTFDPSDPSIMRQRTNDFTQAPIGEQDIPTAAQSIRTRTSKSDLRKGTIYGNQQAQYFVWRAEARRSGDDGHFGGLSLIPDDARGLAAEIRKDQALLEKAGHADAATALEALAEQLEANAEAGITTQWVNASQGRAPAEIRTTLYHELTHEAEKKYTTTKKWFEAQPAFDKIETALSKLGYTPRQHVSEAVAFISGGEYNRLGLSTDEAAAFLGSYFDNMTWRHGEVNAMADFDPLKATPAMRPTIREAKAKYEREGGRYGQPVNREVSGRPAATGTARPADGEQPASGTAGIQRQRTQGTQAAPGTTGQASGTQTPLQQLMAKQKGQSAQSYFDKLIKADPLPDDVSPRNQSIINEARKALRDAAHKAQRDKIDPKQQAEIIQAADDLMIAARLTDAAAIKKARIDLERAVRGGGIKGAAKYAATLPGKAAKSSLTTVFGGDLSFAMRQALPLTVYPKNWYDSLRGVKRMLYSTFSEGQFDKFKSEIEAHPAYDLAQKAGLEFASFGKSEELFESPVAGAPILKQTQRGNEIFLDFMRMQSFAKMAKSIEGNSKLNEHQKADGYKAMAEVVNTLTGRTALKEGAIKSGIESLQSIMTAPRLNYSRAQMLNPLKYRDLYKQSPQAARAMFAQVGSTIGIMSGIGLAAAAAGIGRFVTDRDDPDFGKLVVGNTRYDLYGGLLPIAKVFMDLGEVGVNLGKSFVTDDEETRKELRESRADLGKRLETFARGRLTPAASLGYDIGYKGKDIAGQPVTAKELKAFSFGNPLLRPISPVIAKEMIDGYKDSGWMGVAKQAPSFIGIGASTYNPAERAGYVDRQTPFMKRAKEIGVETKYVPQKQGEPDNLYRERVDRFEGWVNDYGTKLMDHPRFAGLDKEQQQRALKNLKTAASREANEKRPDLSSLAAGRIIRSVLRAEADKPRRDAKKYYAEP